MRIRQFFNATQQIVRWICLSLLLGLTVIVFLKVIFRYLLNSPLVWSDEVIMLLLLTLTYFGAALAIRDRAHINVELLDAFLGRRSESLQKLYHLIMDCVIILMLGLIIYYGVKISFYSSNQETDILLMSYFWVYILLPAGLIFMVLMILSRIYDDWFLPHETAAAIHSPEKGAMP